ncbi:MAG: geranylgeranylglycerol-phosphate geranylgeranyltransferase [Saprospiraceae bacterium]
MRILRFPNLLIVVFTQYLLQYAVLIPNFSAVGITPLLDHLHFALFVLSTLIIAAGGYLINDIVDLKIDQINKPEKMWIGKYCSLAQAWQLYLGLSGLGLLLSLYLALHVGNLSLLLIYPVAVLLLYSYSMYLKKTALWGNLIVAIFCAFVPMIVLFAERSAYQELQLAAPIRASYCWTLFGAYGVFAFCSTLFREIIKDLEDIKGDAAQGCKTLPIVAGVSIAKTVAGTIGFLLLTLLVVVAYFHWQQKQYLQLGFNLLAIVLPLTGSLWKLTKSDLDKAAYHQLSTLAKLIMLFGLIYLIIGLL